MLESWAVFLRLGSLERLVYTRPRHITVFLPQLLYFGAEEKKFEGVAVRHEPRSHVCPMMFLW